jgi:hypothetical protein
MKMGIIRHQCVKVNTSVHRTFWKAVSVGNWLFRDKTQLTCKYLVYWKRLWGNQCLQESCIRPRHHQLQLHSLVPCHAVSLHSWGSCHNQLLLLLGEANNHITAEEIISDIMFICFFFLMWKRNIMYNSLHMLASRLLKYSHTTSQPHRSPRPITGTALLFCVVFIVCNASFIPFIALCAVVCLSMVCYFVVVLL